ncbi:hypothetical protein B0T25DRAFT_199697 [Lasiosphaeria hispida]|uniref:Uncharacterized protein n=1 Tax=Lasiosphaeria hispida TaxID=260671 RepID=A0AAJ0ME20_9PEZI|nr:hypothetical protein B0T25DRAFT_199697 [Lasiosphaeria hispida]
MTTALKLKPVNCRSSQYFLGLFLLPFVLSKGYCQCIVCYIAKCWCNAIKKGKTFRSPCARPAVRGPPTFNTWTVPKGLDDQRRIYTCQAAGYSVDRRRILSSYVLSWLSAPILPLRSLGALEWLARLAEACSLIILLASTNAPASQL